jgi:hypothetical protein
MEGLGRSALALGSAQDGHILEGRRDADAAHLDASADSRSTAACTCTAQAMGLAIHLGGTNMWLLMSRAEGRPDALRSDDCADGSAHERPNVGDKRL